MPMGGREKRGPAGFGAPSVQFRTIRTGNSAPRCRRELFRNVSVCFPSSTRTSRSALRHRFFANSQLNSGSSYYDESPVRLSLRIAKLCTPIPKPGTLNLQSRTLNPEALSLRWGPSHPTFPLGGRIILLYRSLTHRHAVLCPCTSRVLLTFPGSSAPSSARSAFLLATLVPLLAESRLLLPSPLVPLGFRLFADPGEACGAVLAKGCSERVSSTV